MFYFFFQAASHSIFPPCDDCLSLFSDPEEDFQPLTPSGLDLPSNSVVTFSCPISSPSKIPSNPALRLTRRLLHLYKLLTILQLQSQTSLLPPPQLDYSSHFRCLKTINLKLETNFLHLTRFYLTFDPFYQGLTTSNFSLIILLLDINVAVNNIQITHAEQKDPASVDIYNTASNQDSVNGK